MDPRLADCLRRARGRLWELPGGPFLASLALGALIIWLMEEVS